MDGYAYPQALASVSAFQLQKFMNKASKNLRRNKIYSIILIIALNISEQSGGYTNSVTARMWSSL